MKGREPSAALEDGVDGDIRAEVAEGLSRRQKEISPKWFYDERGSELFQQITELPEYYLTRAERALLERFAPELVAALRPHALVELGAGAAAKTRILLDAITAMEPGATYVPIDISSRFLEDAAHRLREEYPRLRVEPVAADISRALRLSPDLPRPALFALLGSTIGNFRPAAAASLLRRVRCEMRDGERLLLGADLDKDPAVLEAAYNDAAGVTADFNRNVLGVLNRDLGTDFDPDAFRHHAFYDGARRRIEMHLVAEQPVTVSVPEVGSFHFAQGESLRTEISCKYDRSSVESMFADAGFALERWLTGEPGFALAVGARA